MCAQRSASAASKPTSRSASPGMICGDSTCGPKRRCEVTTPPRWLMPATSVFLTSKPSDSAASARSSVAVITPWPPMPQTAMLVMVMAASSDLGVQELHRMLGQGMDDGSGRTWLHAQAAAGAGGGLDAHEGELDFLARGLDLGLAPGDVDRRAADVDAVGA